MLFLENTLFGSLNVAVESHKEVMTTVDKALETTKKIFPENAVMTRIMLRRLAV